MLEKKWGSVFPPVRTACPVVNRENVDWPGGRNLTLPPGLSDHLNFLFPERLQHFLGMSHEPRRACLIFAM